MVLDGVDLANFGSNDYLGLAADPRLAQAAIEATRRDGWGGAASPLVTGYGAAHQQLEERLAEFEDTEAALLFPSGFAANVGTIAALVGPGDVVFTDRKNHASLWDGCRLSRADVRVYPHDDWRQLESLLAASRHDRRRLIVTDSLFSMDGDLAPLAELVDLAERYDAMLMIDEAHADRRVRPAWTRRGRAVGRGRAHPDSRRHVQQGPGLDRRVRRRQPAPDRVAGESRPTYIFSTATPAAVAAAALAAIDIVRDEPQRRELLLARAAALRDTLRATAGTWAIGQPDHPADRRRAGPGGGPSAELRNRGLLVPAIRPPTVPQGEACLRISLSNGHTAEMIAMLVEVLGSA